MSLIRRSTPLNQTKIEVRKDGDEQFITGYAAVFYRAADPETEYWLWDDHVERLQPGCFDRAIKEAHDARALYDHDSQNLLGRVSSGTCILSVDNIGLRFDVPIDPDDPDHSRVVPKIRRKDLRGCSFAMNNISATWEEETTDGQTIHIRNITDLDLWDVGPVTYPAYEATECGLRGKSLAVTTEQELIEARSILTAHRNEISNRQLAKKIEIDLRLAQLGQG